MPEEKAFGFVVVTRDLDGDRYLLVKQKDHWSFPKGHAEEGEEPIETARRELLEETGLFEIEPLTQFSFYEEHTFMREGVEILKKNTYFLAIAKADEDVHPQAGEIEECRFVTADEAVKLFTFEGSKQILEDAESALADIDLMA